MLFKDMKPGYPVYILQKGDTLKAVQGKTIKVSDPYFPPAPIGQIPSPSLNTSQRFVDVTLESEGITNTYSIPETLSVSYANNLVLSTDKEGILRDVEAMKSQSEEVVRSVEKHQAIISGCEKILEEWNPAFAEKREQDKRISGLETEVKGLSKMLADFISEFKK